MALFTIGYEGADVPDFISALRCSGVQTLIDIRDLPLSRRAGFSKTPLRAHLEDAGIAYLHMKALGDPREGRLAARSGNWVDFRRIFTRHISSATALEAIRSIVDMSSLQNVCLMCFERDHLLCHRSIVCEEVLKIKPSSIKNIGVSKGFSTKAA